MFTSLKRHRAPLILALLLAAPLSCGSPEATDPRAGSAPGQTQEAPHASTPVGPSNLSAATSMNDGAVPGDAADPAAPAALCDVNATGTRFAASCSACAGEDACASCLCNNCTATVEACTHTPGCMDILGCVKDSDCTGIDCYCGDATVVACSEGKGNGMCKDAFLSAPGGKAPTLRDPSAGPASDRAVAVADCMAKSGRCAPACGASESN